MKDRIEFATMTEDRVLLGQGRMLVLIQIVGGRRLKAAVVLTPDEAEAMARSLRRRARYARDPG